MLIKTLAKGVEQGWLAKNPHHLGCCTFGEGGARSGTWLGRAAARERAGRACAVDRSSR